MSNLEVGLIVFIFTIFLVAYALIELNKEYIKDGYIVLNKSTYKLIKLNNINMEQDNEKLN
jgi:hypothetical protein